MTDAPAARQRAASFATGLLLNVLLAAVAVALGLRPVQEQWRGTNQKTTLTFLAGIQPSRPKPRAPLPRPKIPPPLVHRLTVAPPIPLASPPELPRQATAQLLAPAPAAVVPGPSRGPVILESFTKPPAATVLPPRASIVATGIFGRTVTQPRQQADTLRTGAFSSAAISDSTPARGPAAVSNGAFSSAAVPGTPGHAAGHLAPAAGFDSAATTIASNRVVIKNTSASGFDAPQLTAARRITSTVLPAAFQSVEIVAKPKPEYTDEARRLHVEGEVWLEVLFGADGSTRIERVVRSLGHGLDENAIAAARQIRFRPAREGPQPVDQIATVRIRFELAD